MFQWRHGRLRVRGSFIWTGTHRPGAWGPIFTPSWGPSVLIWASWDEGLCPKFYLDIRVLSGNMIDSLIIWILFTTDEIQISVEHLSSRPYRPRSTGRLQGPLSPSSSLWVHLLNPRVTRQDPVREVKTNSLSKTYLFPIPPSLLPPTARWRTAFGWLESLTFTTGSLVFTPVVPGSTLNTTVRLRLFSPSPTRSVFRLKGHC